LTGVELAAAGEFLFGRRWQTQLARRIGVDSSTVRRWLSGARPIPKIGESCIGLLLEQRGMTIAAVTARRRRRSRLEGKEVRHASG
jgi:hypothetical protein